MVAADTDRVSAVNTMLSLIGEAPVSSLAGSLTHEVQVAVNTLDEVLRDLLLEGWVWNTEHKVRVSPNGDGKFPWQDRWLSFDLDAARYSDWSLVRRGGFLFDQLNSSYTFSTAEIEGVAVVKLDFEDIPEAARAYLRIRAGRKFLDRLVGDAARQEYTREDELRARTLLDEHEADQGDGNLFANELNIRAARRDTRAFR